jgi:hypothetical protein
MLPASTDTGGEADVTDKPSELRRAEAMARDRHLEISLCGRRNDGACGRGRLASG